MHILFRSVVAVAVTVLIGFTVLFIRHGADADAQVVHGTGYEATVMGWTSWYGSYVLDGVGVVWCIDHGLRAPDSDYGYRPTAPPAISGRNRTAMAWILSRHGSAPTRADTAAVMLALHDLNGAVYPQGPLRLETLTADRFAGFDGQDAGVFSRAVEILRDGLAHADLRGPLELTITAPERSGPSGAVTASVSVHDADGRPVDDIHIDLVVAGATPASMSGVTGSDGTVDLAVTMSHDTVQITARATVPDLDLKVYGPSGAPAQRVGRAGTRDLDAQTIVRAPTPPTTTTIPPTTTSTTPPTTTTTPPTTTTTPPTTTTTVPPTTTTVPPTTTTTTPPTTTTTTVPPTTTTTTLTTTTTVPPTTTTIVPPTTTTTLPPSSTVPGIVPPPPSSPGLSRTPAPPTNQGILPVTGGRQLGLTLIGLGLILAGSGVLIGAGNRRGRA